MYESQQAVKAEAGHCVFSKVHQGQHSYSCSLLATDLWTQMKPEDGCTCITKQRVTDYYNSILVCYFPTSIMQLT
jgi:hypothetical protein